MQAENLLQLFLHELSTIHDAERRLTRLLTAMAGAVAEPSVRRALAAHAAETDRQVERLERCFAAMRATPQETRCRALAGIEADYDAFVRDVNPPQDALVAYVLGAASRTEHFEVAAYTALVDMATLLDRPDAATILAEIRREELAARDAIETLRGEYNRQAEARMARDLTPERLHAFGDRPYARPDAVRRDERGVPPEPRHEP
jgi:ferritin-like metal-binding protein YciE